MLGLHFPSPFCNHVMQSHLALLWLSSSRCFQECAAKISHATNISQAKISRTQAKYKTLEVHFVLRGMHSPNTISLSEIHVVYHTLKIKN